MTEQGKERKFRISFNKILYNDKLLLVFSFLAAIIVWVIIAVNFSESVVESLSDVKFTIDLEETVPESFGLEVFNVTEFELEQVRISGRRYQVANLNAEDLVITADVSSVTAAGSYAVPVTVQTKNSDLTVVSWEPQYVVAYFDEFRAYDSNIEVELLGDDLVADGYYLGTPVLSVSEVNVSGPATEVNKVEHVVARYTVEDPLDATTTVQPDLVALDSYGNEVNNIELDYGATLSLTIIVLKQAEMDVGVTFAKVPAGIDTSKLKISYSPSKLEIAADESTLENMDRLIVGEIDFSTLNPDLEEQVFTFELDDLNVTVLDDSVTEVTVTLDLNDYEGVSLSVPSSNIQVTNVMDGYTARVNTGTIQVRVMGPADSLDDLSASDITLTVDLSDVTVAQATAQYDAALTIGSHDNCWVLGTYRVSISLVAEDS